MPKLIDELKNAKVFYLATLENGNQPRVRPLTALNEFKNRIYICTNKHKPVYRQLCMNHKFEISATCEDGSWLRVSGELASDLDPFAKTDMLKNNPQLQTMYKATEGEYVLFFFSNYVGKKYYHSGEIVDLD
jgi:uncharacterized pyridoxamine 5'-phosphate oxidase family protein